MNIVGRIDLAADAFASASAMVASLIGVAVESLFHGAKTQRPVGDAHRADMDIGSLAAVFIIEHRRAGQGEVAAAAGEFAKAEAPLRAATRQSEFR